MITNRFERFRVHGFLYFDCKDEIDLCLKKKALVKKPLVKKLVKSLPVSVFMYNRCYNFKYPVVASSKSSIWKIYVNVRSRLSMLSRPSSPSQSVFDEEWRFYIERGGLLVLMEMNLYLVVKELISGIGINLSTNLQKKKTQKVRIQFGNSLQIHKETKY